MFKGPAIKVKSAIRDQLGGGKALGGGGFGRRPAKTSHLSTNDRGQVVTQFHHG